MREREREGNVHNETNPKSITTLPPFITNSPTPKLEFIEKLEKKTRPHNTTDFDGDFQQQKKSSFASDAQIDYFENRIRVYVQLIQSISNQSINQRLMVTSQQTVVEIKRNIKKKEMTIFGEERDG